VCLRNNNNNKLFTPEQLLNQFEDSSIPQSALIQPNNWSDAFSAIFYETQPCVKLPRPSRSQPASKMVSQHFNTVVLLLK